MTFDGESDVLTTGCSSKALSAMTAVIIFETPSPSLKMVPCGRSMTRLACNIVAKNERIVESLAKNLVVDLLPRRKQYMLTPPFK